MVDRIKIARKGSIILTPMKDDHGKGSGMISVGPDSSTDAADAIVEYVNVAPTASDSSACSVVDQPGIIITPFTLCDTVTDAYKYIDCWEYICAL